MGARAKEDLACKVIKLRKKNKILTKSYSNTENEEKNNKDQVCMANCILLYIIIIIKNEI